MFLPLDENSTPRSFQGQRSRSKFRFFTIFGLNEHCFFHCNYWFHHISIISHLLLGIRDIFLRVSEDSSSRSFQGQRSRSKFRFFTIFGLNEHCFIHCNYWFNHISIISHMLLGIMDIFLPASENSPSRSFQGQRSSSKFRIFTIFGLIVHCFLHWTYQFSHMSYVVRYQGYLFASKWEFGHKVISRSNTKVNV